MNIHIEFVCSMCAETDTKKFDKRDKHVCKKCLKQLLKEAAL